VERRKVGARKEAKGRESKRVKKGSARKPT